MGGSFVLTGLAMIASSRIGKLRARDRTLDALALRGDERVLDVGCGRGLMLIGAAKRVPRGKAVGVDVWSQRDLSENDREATLANARAEGVGGRVRPAPRLRHPSLAVLPSLAATLRRLEWRRKKKDEPKLEVSESGDANSECA